MRRAVGCVLAASVLTLTACTTTVDGTGRPAAAPATGSSSSPSGSPTTGTSATGSPTGGSTSSGAAPLDLWNTVHDAVVDLPAVTVSGTFSGAAFGPTATGEAAIQATFGAGDDGPLATVVVKTAGQVIEVRATGGTAWAKASAAFLTGYGYTAAEAAQAGGKWAVLTDDDSGLDVLASLEAFLQICGPDDSTDDLTASPDSSGKILLVSQFDGGTVTVTADPPRITTSAYTGDALTFDYPIEAPTVEAPPAAEVVTVPDF